MDKEYIRERLIEEGYIVENGIDGTIDRLCQLDGKAGEMFQYWLETKKIIKFEAIQGIDVQFLRKELKMKDPAIILAYGMLLKDPERNAMLIKRMVNNKISMKFPQ